MNPAPAIRTTAYVGVIDLGSLIDLNRIDAMALQKIQALSPQINVSDLGAWRLLIKLVYNCGSDLGIAKRVITYASDQEKEWSLCIPVPNQTQANYGLADQHFVSSGRTLDHRLFHVLDPQFDRYADLQSCMESNVLRALEAAFAIGITVSGKRIQARPS